MATAKKPTSKAKAVPVRVVRTATPRPKPAPVATPQSTTTSRRRVVKARPQEFKPEGDRRVAMWSGVVLAAAIIFVLWIAIVRVDLSKPTGADSLLGKIRTSLQDLFSSSKNKSNTNAADQQLNQLRNQVFPNINDDTFTTNTNLNGNSNQNGNLNSNTNTSNSNSSVNQNTNR